MPETYLKIKYIIAAAERYAPVEHSVMRAEWLAMEVFTEFSVEILM